MEHGKLYDNEIPVQQIQLQCLLRFGSYITPTSCAYIVYIRIGSKLFTLCTINDDDDDDNNNNNNELWYLTTSRRISRFLNNSLQENFVSRLPNRF
jgi:hypothetical protein